jgi:serine O-acetyltransferase
MKLKGFSRDQLVGYVADQADHLFPDRHRGDVRPAVASAIDAALGRLERCIAGVRMWRAGEFDPLHSSQYTTFLYYLANTLWRERGDERVCTKLFYLNKALNGFECFYDNELPEIFFIGHTVGIVLVRNRYPSYFVIYQNATVGKGTVDGEVPELGEGVIMYPNSAIIGGCRVGARTVISQGTSVVNADTPGDCVVYRNGRDLVFARPKRNILADYFRI